MHGTPYLTLALFLLAVAALRQFGQRSACGDSDLVNTWLFYSVLVVGFYFVFGVSGQFAFSQAAFAAVGGYTSAWATREAGARHRHVLGRSPDRDRRGVCDRLRVRVPHATRVGVLPRHRHARASADHARSAPALDRLHRVGRRHHRGHPRPITIFGFEISSQSRVPDLLGVARRGRDRDGDRHLAGAARRATRSRSPAATRTSSPRRSACPCSGFGSRCSCSALRSPPRPGRLRARGRASPTPTPSRSTSASGSS